MVDTCYTLAYYKQASVMYVTGGTQRQSSGTFNREERNMSADNAHESGFSQTAGKALARLMDWGLPKVKPKTMQEANKLAATLTKRWVTITASISWVPGSTLVLMGMDYKLYNDMARIYGVTSFNIDAVTATVAATVAGRTAAEALTFIVGVGWVIKAGVAAGATKILCEAVAEYMRGQSPLK